MKDILILILFGVSCGIIDAPGQSFPVESTSNPYLNSVLPDFQGTTLDGKEFKLSSQRGKVVLVIFWSLGCAACFKELPELNKIAREFGSEKLTIVSVMPDEKEKVDEQISGSGQRYLLNRAIAGNRNVDFMIVPNGEKIMHKYFTDISVPRAFVIDKSGTLTYCSDGFLQLLHDNDFVKEANYKNFKAVLTPLCQTRKPN